MTLALLRASYNNVFHNLLPLVEFNHAAKNAGYATVWTGWRKLGVGKNYENIGIAKSSSNGLQFYHRHPTDEMDLRALRMLRERGFQLIKQD